MNETASHNAELQFYASRSASRRVGAAVSGCFAGLFMSGAIQAGAQFFYSDENPYETWGIFFWGDHWRLRAVASLTAAAWAGFLAGVIARGRGDLLGAVSVLPAAALWVASSAWAWQSGLDYPLYDKLLGAFLAVAMPIVAFKTGARGAALGAAFGGHFDSRSGTLLGIKWFHYLWAPIVFNVLVVQSAWALIYGSRWLFLSMAARPLVFSIIPTFFFIGIIGTLLLTYVGLSKAYSILAGIDRGVHSPGIAVLKFGCGLPFIAVLIQGLIRGLHYFVTRLFN